MVVPTQPTTTRNTISNPNSQMIQAMKSKAACFVFAAANMYVLSLMALSFISQKGHLNLSESSGEGEEVSPRTALRNNANTIGAENNPLKVSEGEVSYIYNFKTHSLPYYHCGPLPFGNPDLTELVLLHGAAFTKEDWKTSGILDMLCEINNDEDGGNLSITALDLPVSADGQQLGLAFDALSVAGAEISESRAILSGNPATFVTPSASGKSIVSLAEISSNPTSSNKEKNELARIVKGWVPVASRSVLETTESALQRFNTGDGSRIPILAIYGDQDSMGKETTERLVKTSDAKGVELDGRHPVYLDSPDDFVREVLQFLDEEGF